MKTNKFKNLILKNKFDSHSNSPEIAQSELSNEQMSTLLKISAFFKSIIPKMRFGFAGACENSRIIRFVEELYAKFLSCQTRVIGVYFLTFSLVSMLIKYFNFSSFIDFLFSNEIVPLLFILVISLVLFASKKEIGKLITTSVLMADFRITYSQPATAAFYSAKNLPQGYSTSFFLGIFSAFLSVVYPISSVFSFLAIILFLLCSINRPESSILLTVFLIPFLNTKGLFIIILITFFSLFYKFMRCKRHISCGVTEILMLLLCFCFAASTSVANESVVVFIKYLLPLLLAFVCMNIVRSTSMLESCYKMLLGISSIYSFIVLILYVLIILFGYNQVMPIATAQVFSPIILAITDKFFSQAFIVICVPIVFARLISTRQLYHLFTLIIMLLYSSVFCSFTEILIIILSCFAVLCFYSIKNIFLAVASPFVAYFVSLPGNYLSDLLHFGLPEEANSIALNRFLAIFKNNILFGNGFATHNPVNTGAGNLILSCGFIGTLVILTLVLRIVIKNIRFSATFDLTKTNLKAASAALSVSSIFFIILGASTHVYSDIRCICLYAVVLSLTRNVQRCVKADFIDPYAVREYEI